MYQAKQSRTGIAVYDPPQDINSLERLKTVQQLHKTIQEGRFLIQYQPILSILDRAVSKWEALVCWEHPTRGLLRPNEFVPLAEESGLIGELDLAVLRQAVQDQRRLGGELAINFSAVTLAHPNWVCEVVHSLVEETLQPSMLWLEITESALLPERQKWLGGLVALRGLGVRVALDDFGMGYSSLAHLKQVPIDLIKIDKSFVAEIRAEPDLGGYPAGHAAAGQRLWPQDPGRRGGKPDPARVAGPPRLPLCPGLLHRAAHVARSSNRRDHDQGVLIPDSKR